MIAHSYPFRLILRWKHAPLFRLILYWKRLPLSMNYVPGVYLYTLALPNIGLGSYCEVCEGRG